MTRLRRLRLGLRLGLAFAVLLAALAITVAVGVSNLRALDVKSSDSAQGQDAVAQRSAAEVAEGTHRAAHDTVRHLYVYDGDLEAEDAIAAAIAADQKTVAAALAGLPAVVHTAAARSALDPVRAHAARYAKLVGDALARSRRETVDGVEERDGSRAVYPAPRSLPLLDGKLAPAVERLQGVIAADARADIATAADRAHAGQSQLLVVGVAALLLAIALAFLITRSVTVPVRALAARLRAVQEHDLAALQGGVQALSAGDLTIAVAATTEPLEDRGRDEVANAAKTVDAVIAQAHDSIAAYEQTRAEPRRAARRGDPLGPGHQRGLAADGALLRGGGSRGRRDHQRDRGPGPGLRAPDRRRQRRPAQRRGRRSARWEALDRQRPRRPLRSPRPCPRGRRSRASETELSARPPRCARSAPPPPR